LVIETLTTGIKNGYSHFENKNQIRRKRRQELLTKPKTTDTSEITPINPVPYLRFPAASGFKPRINSSLFIGNRPWGSILRHSTNMRANGAMRQIAGLMGWSVRTATQVIEHYAQASPDKSDAVLCRLNQTK
jgi:hypothetical protein